jgi:hypothetical protein
MRAFGMVKVMKARDLGLLTMDRRYGVERKGESNVLEERGCEMIMKGWVAAQAKDCSAGVMRVKPTAVNEQEVSDKVAW